MIGDNHRISLRQTSWILAMDILAAGLFMMPVCLGGLNFREMTGTGITVLVVVFFYYALSFYWLDMKNQEQCGRLQSGQLPVTVCVVLIVYYLAALVYSLILFYQVIDELIPADYSYPVTILFLLAAVIYGGGKGVEVRGRMAELTGLLVFVPFVILFLAGFWQALGYGWPVTAEFKSGWRDICSRGWHALWVFFLADHPLLLWRQTRMKTKERKVPVQGLTGGCLMVLAALVLTGLFFTPEGMAAEAQPFGILLQMIRFPGNFISRYDTFFVMLWMFCFYIFAEGMLLETVELAVELSGGNRRWMALLFGALTFVLVILARQYDNFDRIFDQWMRWAGVPVCVLLIPACVWKWCKVERNGVK